MFLMSEGEGPGGRYEENSVAMGANQLQASAWDGLTRGFIDLMERGLLPDAVVRLGIRRMLAERAAQANRPEAAAETARFVESLSASPVALSTDAANEQHYEVPEAFYGAVLGPRRKYSCCYYPAGVNGLAGAEEAALALVGERAELYDGMRLLELGCGWGSFTLWAAEHYPGATIVAVSNSNSQRAYIESQCRARGLGNVEVRTCDMNTFEPGVTFDRMVSIEMFEHLRNWPEAFRRVASWLAPEGRFFMHVFCHRSLAYPYETEGAANWMARHFFTGGMMPSADLPGRFSEHLAVAQQWTVDGRHYQRTCEDWLRNQDARRASTLSVLAEAGDGAEASRWFQRWRVFFMACAELFGYRDGTEWFVSHYLMRRA